MLLLEVRTLPEPEVRPVQEDGALHAEKDVKLSGVYRNTGTDPGTRAPSC